MPFANKEDERAYRKEYYKLNKEKIKKRANKHYYDNIEHHKKVYKEYRTTDNGKETIKLGRANEKLERLKSTEKAIAKNTHYKKWCNTEDALLLQMKENKASWKNISEALSRSLKSVEARYVKLTKEQIK